LKIEISQIGRVDYELNGKQALNKKAVTGNLRSGSIIRTKSNSPHTKLQPPGFQAKTLAFLFGLQGTSIIFACPSVLYFK